MTNTYIDYYKSQAGSGLAGFQGVRYQRGHGFFGRLLSNAVYPLLRFLGKKAMSVGANIASDVIVDKKNWRDSAKDRLNDATVDMTKAGVARVKDFVQTGQGRIRKTKVSKKSLKMKKIKNLIQTGHGIKRKITKKRGSSKSIKRLKPIQKGNNDLAKLLKNASNYS